MISFMLRYFSFLLISYSSWNHAKNWTKLLHYLWTTKKYFMKFHIFRRHSVIVNMYFFHIFSNTFSYKFCSCKIPIFSSFVLYVTSLYIFVTNLLPFYSKNNKNNITSWPFFHKSFVKVKNATLSILFFPFR